MRSLPKYDFNKGRYSPPVTYLFLALMVFLKHVSNFLDRFNFLDLIKGVINNLSSKIVFTRDL